MLCVFPLLLYSCQCQCNRLPGKTHLRKDLLCVEWDVKPYTLTHSKCPFTVLRIPKPPVVNCMTHYWRPAWEQKLHPSTPDPTDFISVATHPHPVSLPSHPSLENFYSIPTRPHKDLFPCPFHPCLYSN